ncbi:MAG: DUF975 family protein [Eubacterium sp.]|nr:DUF975 family protein [Eubacterium sp.]
MSGGQSVTGSVANQGGNLSQMTEDIPSEAMVVIAAVVVAVASVVAVIGLIQFIVGAFVSLGLIQFNMNLIDGRQARFGDIFSKTSMLGKALWLRIRIAIFTFLWTLLLIVPGIIKSFAYSMAGFIMAENPEIDAKEAMEVSMAMMQGNKWRLFCLNLSFIGWGFLCLLTFGIGFFWLSPYTNAATAAFYDEVSREYAG